MVRAGCGVDIVQTWLHQFHKLCLLCAVAMKAMNKVASHINEMQKIHEEFGAVFDQLILEQSGEKKEVGKNVFCIPSVERDTNELNLCSFDRLWIFPWVICFSIQV